MLFWDVGVEPDDAHMEDVDSETNVGVLSDFVPGLLHTFGPMDVVEDEDTGERSFVVRCDFRRGVVAQQWEELSS